MWVYWSGFATGAALVWSYYKTRDTFREWKGFSSISKEAIANESKAIEMQHMSNKARPKWLYRGVMWALILLALLMSIFVQIGLIFEA